MIAALISVTARTSLGTTVLKDFNFNFLRHCWCSPDCDQYSSMVLMLTTICGNCAIWHYTAVFKLLLLVEHSTIALTQYDTSQQDLNNNLSRGKLY